MADTASPQSVEIASGAIISMQMNNNGSDKYTPVVHVVPSDIGGLTVHSFINDGTDDDATLIQAGASMLYGFDFYSIQAAPIYLKFYNVASQPTAGTTALFLRFGIPEEVTAGSGHGLSRFFSHGIAFGTGLAFALITGITDADSTAATAANVIGNIYYK